MKNIVTLLIWFCILQANANAQTESLYLLQSEKTKTPDGIMEWKYYYDENNQISKVVYWQDGKIFYTENQFINYPNGFLKSYSRIYSNGKTPSELHEFEYDNTGKIALYKYSNGGKKEINNMVFQYGMKYQYKENQIIVQKGNIASEEYSGKYIYAVNENGNFSKKEKLYMDGSEISSPTAYYKYDNNINPHLLRSNYRNEKLEPANNCLSQNSNSSAKSPIEISIQYNTKSLPEKKVVSYDYENYKVEHSTTYTYTSKKK